MGFQNELAKTPRIEPISKATKPNKTEPNAAGDPKDSKPDLSLCADVKYISWLVSSPLFMLTQIFLLSMILLRHTASLLIFYFYFGDSKAQ